MSTKSENPYESPTSAAKEPPSSIRSRLTCPACREYTMPLWKAYYYATREYLIASRCRSCRVRIYVKRSWLAILALNLLCIPLGIVGGALLIDLIPGQAERRFNALQQFTQEYVSLPLFGFAVLAILAVDYLICYFTMYVDLVKK